MSSSDEIREFDVSKCFECPVRTHCSVGQLVSEVWEPIDEAIDNAQRDTYEDAVLTGHISDHDDEDTEQYVELYRTRMTKIHEMASSNRTVINDLVSQALKAKKQASWRHIEADPYTAELEKIVDEHSELFESFASDDARALVEEIAVDVRSYTDRNICKAAIRTMQD